MLLRSLLLTLFVVGTPLCRAEDWPQFRGPRGLAVSETAAPPVGLSHPSNQLWNVVLPSGNSSPVVTGDKVFLTGAEGSRLVTLCLNRLDGRVLWKREAPIEPLKAWDPMTPGPATPTPVTDGSSVYVFFGAFGLIAYDLSGQELWRQPLARPDLEASASPILIGQSLILVCDRDRDSFLEAREKSTGRQLWRVERAQFSRSRATPFHWVHSKGEELIVPGSLSLTSYNPLNGEQKWYYNGTSRVATSSPTADGSTLFSSSSNIGDNDSFSASPKEPDPGSFGVSSDFFPAAPAAPGADRPPGGKGVLAIQSCGRGDITRSHLVWMTTRSLPYSASPLLYRGRLFTIKAGGLASAYEAKTGRPIYQDERLGKPGVTFTDFYASPVAAAGRIHLVSAEGIVTIIDADADRPVVLDQHALGERATATPALTGKMILIRTDRTLHAFGSPR